MIESIKILFKSSDSQQLSLDRYNTLYKEHNEFIRKSIYWMVRTDSIDDIVQETFCKAWKNRASFDNRSSYKTWIYRIAMNCCYDFISKEKKKLDLEVESSDFSIDQNSNKDLISKALSLLKPKSREIFILFYKFGYTQDEIANLTETKIGTVKSQIHYAKKEFTEFLRKNGVTDEGQ
jgi:RNA polymerase sigma-70 factor (ECF subfamily)